jgi:hypothetical protein
MPMWAQTYNNGHRYYREHIASRSHGICPAASGSIPCHIADEQVIQLIENIELGDQWLEEVLAIINLKDEVETVKKKKQVTQEKFRRMAKAYIDGVFPDEEYHRQKKLLEMELESLFIPQINKTEEAGKLIMELPRLWSKANEEEKRKLLLAMLDAVYIDTKETKSVIAIKPKPPFKPVLQVAASKKNSAIHIISEPLKGSSLFVVETGEGWSLPETMLFCFSLY